MEAGKVKRKWAELKYGVKSYLLAALLVLFLLLRGLAVTLFLFLPYVSQ